MRPFRSWPNYWPAPTEPSSALLPEAAPARSGKPLLLAGLGALLLLTGGLLLLAGAGVALLRPGSAPAAPAPAQALPPASAPPPAIRLVIPPARPAPQDQPDADESLAPVEASEADAPMPSPAQLQELVEATLLEVQAALPAAESPQSGTGGPRLPASAPRPVGGPVSYKDLFQAVGAESGWDWRLLAALAYRESRLDPLALGRDNDMGLMQILPSTWNEFAPGVAAVDPFDPWDSARVAASYLSYLQERLAQGGHGEIYWVLAAYNWGPDNVERLLDRNGEWYDMPARQRGYVADILEAAFGP